MESVGLLIFFAIVGAFICAKARSAGGAIAFSLVALVLFIATPVGSGLPGAVSDFLDVVDGASTPALTEPGDGAGAVG
jgi:multisubunit Na+/H+ antiporter MnhG subunit